MASAGTVYVYPNEAAVTPYGLTDYYIGKTALSAPDPTNISVYNSTTNILIDNFSFTRAGYTFKEWNTSSDGTGTTYNVGDSVTGTGTKNLYAIWQEENHDVKIKYNNAVIGSLDASGTKTLLTSGKYCMDDIAVEYTKPTPNLQSKTASPTTSSRTITADSGYDGLSQVTVSAISPTKSSQTYTPTTTDQTIASGRWLTGTQTIKGDANLVASNIKKDVQIFGVTGSYEGSGGGGSSPVEENDVNFIDYDGTLLYSYTASEFANLSALPANPSHEGLVAQGWNWTLANAKTYVASYRKLWIGQMYITESGDTEIDVELQAPRLSPWLSLAVNGTLEVDWGDGSTKSTVTGTSTAAQNMTPHVYATDGSYTIKIHVVSGSFNLLGTSTYPIFSGNFLNADNNRVYANNIKRVRIGSSLAELKAYAFNSCSSLASITIPSSVTSIGIYAFLNCYALASITIPSGVTSISNYIFQYCDALASIAIPSSVTSIGSYAFSNCYSLASITIPSGVTSIGTYAFSSCLSLASITIPSGVTSIGARVFNNCYALASITIPSGVTSISNSAFDFCYSLASITIPSSVTSIGSYAFEKCYALASITIPSGVPSIGNSAFINCRGVGLIRFERTTPPTVATSSTWSNIPTDCVILIPYNSDSYIGATNYPSSSTYSYVGYMTSVSGENLPTQTTSTNYTLNWFATKEEAASGTGTQLTQGNGNEIYCIYSPPMGGGGSND